MFFKALLISIIVIFNIAFLYYNESVLLTNQLWFNDSFLKRCK